MAISTKAEQSSKSVISDLWSSFAVPPSDPPVGSNRPQGHLMAHVLLIIMAPTLTIMSVGAWLIPTMHETTRWVSTAWACLLVPLTFLWPKVSHGAGRFFILLVLALVQVRFLLSWMFLDDTDLFASTVTGLIVTPLLLFIVALQEGRRNGVIIGVLVALAMGVATHIGPSREDLAATAFADTRIAIPTFMTMLIYAVLVNAWTGQQEQLKDIELQAIMLQQQANADLETGLLNDKGLRLVANGWIHRRQPFAVLALRLDGLASLVTLSLNDQARVLSTELGKHLQDNLAQPVTLARWDAQTYVLLSHLADQRSVERFAQRLRRMIAGLADKTAIPQTISIGFSILASQEEFDVGINRAVSALKEASGLGNCVRSCL